MSLTDMLAELGVGIEDFTGQAAVRVAFHPDVYKQLQRLSRPAFAAALNAVIALLPDPRPAGVKKLAGSGSDWRIRVGEYRILYEVDDPADTLTVFRVAHRREAYR